MSTATADLLCVFTEETSNKFWRAEVFDTELMYVTYGRIGTACPQRQVKKLNSKYAAVREASKKYQAKIDKGYRAVPQDERFRFPSASDVAVSSAGYGGFTPPATAVSPPPSVQSNVGSVSIRTLDLDD